MLNEAQSSSEPRNIFASHRQLDDQLVARTNGLVSNRSLERIDVDRTSQA